MKIAHISDFHARRYLPGHPQIHRRRSRSMPVLIERAIAEIRSHQPDVLVVTGDLVDVPFYGMKQETVVDRVTRDLRALREVIDNVGCPVFYLFGNHDHPGAFQEVFSDMETDLVIGGYRFVTFFDHEVRDHFAERCDEERARFDRVLADDDPTPQVHLQHYMISPEHNQGYPHAYREAAALKAALVASGKVVLSLSGHYHVGSDATLEDGVWFATSRAFCEPPHPYRIYEVSDGCVKQTEYELGTAQLGRALFVDLNAVTGNASDKLVSQLAQAQSSGWSIVGVTRLSGQERQAFEIANDAACEHLSNAGLQIDALMHSFKDEIDGGPYFEGARDLGIDLKTSRAVVSSSAEESAAQSAGVETVLATSADAVGVIEGWCRDA